MATRTHRKALRLVSTALFAAVLLHRGAEAAELKVCVDKSNPAARMDASVARAVGRQLGETTRITWFDGLGDDDDGLKPRGFRKLAGSGDCDLILGFPVDVLKRYLPDGLKATQPYARTGFVLVTRKHAPVTLETLPKGSVVALTYMTAPNLYFANHLEVSPQVFTSDGASLRALEQGQVMAAMLWRPFVAQQVQRMSKGTLNVNPLDQPHAAWYLVALYAESAQAVATQFEQAIAQLRDTGALKPLLQPYADPVDTAPVSTAATIRTARLAMTAWPGAHLVAVANKKEPPSKLPPALYTADQATAGQAVFQTNCAVCHGPKLEGRAGPALKGLTFATPAAHFSVSDVFKIVSQNMPAPAPGTLPQEDYVNIMSFLLQQNGYPAGSTPMTFDSAGKSKVKLIYREQPAN